MHKLSRSVRFSINPFLPQDQAGANSYASRPSGEGVAIFFELAVTLAGEVEPSTGFVVNVTEIDDKARRFVVPIFAKRLRSDFARGRHIGLDDLAELLRSSQKALAGKFGQAGIAALALKLSPFKKIGMEFEGSSEETEMVYYSEKFEFAAMHKLWNDNFSEQRNFEVFGKCASKAGHGHNYIVEVTVKTAPGASFTVGNFEKVVNDELIELVDHKNLNEDVAEFTKAIPTVENLAVFAWDKLVGKFDNACLHGVTVWETDRTSCSYYGAKNQGP